MLKVLFFGRIRDQLDCAQLTVPLDAGCQDLDALQQHLEASHGEDWVAALREANVIRAVNKVVVPDNVALAEGDEVAFFPPVTGG